MTNCRQVESQTDIASLLRGGGGALLTEVSDIWKFFGVRAVFTKANIDNDDF